MAPAPEIRGSLIAVPPPRRRRGVPTAYSRASQSSTSAVHRVHGQRRAPRGHIIDICDVAIDEGIRIIDVRHEQVAAQATDGWSRVTGVPLVAVVTAGRRTTDTVTGVPNAFRAQTPMLVISGQEARTQYHMGGLQEFDHVSIVKTITEFVTAVLLASQTTGGALGSIAAPAKVIVGGSTVGLSGEEGPEIKQSLAYGIVITLIIGILTLNWSDL